MIEDVVKTEQIRYISEGLGYPQTLIKTVLDSYTGYLKYLMERRYECTFLGIVVFKNSELEGHDERETYAYQARTVSEEIGVPYIQVKSILDYLRDMIRHDVPRGIAYTIMRLMKIGITSDGSLSLKSSKTVPVGIRVRATNRFRYEINTKELV